jgi:hypothetical protein
MTRASGVDQAVDATPFAASDGTPTYSIKREFSGATVMITGEEGHQPAYRHTYGIHPLVVHLEVELHGSLRISPRTRTNAFYAYLQAHLATSARW